MARTATGAVLTRQHRRQQLALRAATLRDLTLLWGAVQVADLSGTIVPFAAAAAVLVRARHRDSAGLAARYYGQFRAAEGVGGEVTPRIAETPSAQAAAGLLRGAALAGIMGARRRGFTPQAAARQGLVRASGSATRQVLAGSRETIIGSTDEDLHALGWARVTASQPCPWCAMQASRGPVFGSRDASAFEPHDHCNCHPEPAYEGAEWPGRGREFKRLWDQAQTEAREAGELGRGTSNDALNAFRRSFEGRE